MRRLINKIYSLFRRIEKPVKAEDFFIKGIGSVVSPKDFAIKPNCYFSVGDNSMFCGTVYFDRESSKVLIGDRTYVAGNIMCAQKITIGDDVLISSGGAIFDHDSHSLDFELRKNDVVNYIKGFKDWSHVAIKDVEIGNKVWIGHNVIILKGIKIGEGAVVAAGSVVTKDIEPYTLVAGNPGKVIRKLL